MRHHRIDPSPKTYLCPDPTRRSVFVRRGDRIEPLRHIVLHSPTGMLWGYAGSGPSDLALSILCDHAGASARLTGDDLLSAPSGHPYLRAERLHQQFKEDVVSRWPMDEPWSISEQEIADWVAEHESSGRARPETAPAPRASIPHRRPASRSYLAPLWAIAWAVSRSSAAVERWIWRALRG